MKLCELLEGLKPSQYRRYVQGWDKSKYNDIFNNKYRIELPTPPAAATNSDIRPDPNVVMAIQNAGYEIADYKAGLAKKDNRQIKIGKILTDPTILQRFANDPARAGTKSQYKIIISRHPYDIAGMSTNRGWSSCMNLGDTTNQPGSNRHYISADVREGTIIAYLVKSDDTNITKPVARVLIKPFIDTLTKDVALGVEDRVYGTAPDWFAKTVVSWADKVNSSKKLNGVFRISPSLYNDSGVGSKIVGNPKPEQILDALKNANTSSKIEMFNNDLITEEILVKCADFRLRAIEEIIEAARDAPNDINTYITPAVQIAWCNRSEGGGPEIVDELLSNGVKVCEKAINIAMAYSYDTMWVLRRRHYEPITDKMIELATESLMNQYSSDDMTVYQLCELIDAFRRIKLDPPTEALEKIANDGEAALYYGNINKIRFEEGEEAMVRDTPDDSLTALLRYAVTIYRQYNVRPSIILHKLKNNDTAWKRYTELTQ